MKQKTAILVGAGARGQIYAAYARQHPEQLRIVAVAEPKAERRAVFCHTYDPCERNLSAVSEGRRFTWGVMITPLVLVIWESN